MPHKLLFGDPSSIAKRNSVAKAETPIQYMHELHERNEKKLCIGCKWFVTKFAYGESSHECLQFGLATGSSARWKPNWVACGKHEPMERRQFS